MNSINLDQGWEFQAPDNLWLTARVPGCIHSDLVDHGLIEDPFVRQNEAECQWVDERSWSYRCRFTWAPNEVLPHCALIFEGLDTICSVFLNGCLLSEHDNMFVPLELHVADKLRVGENELRVDFKPAAQLGRARKAAYLAEQKLTDDVPNFDERAFVRKAQYMFGWDWGPRLVSCGIWKSVYLIETAEPWISNSPDAVRPAAQLIQTPDQYGVSFEFQANGRRIFAAGANWIPDHSFPSQVTAERTRQRIQQAKDIGVNMLRVWGGGIYESDEFYDACDELGILVWQDFMFACSYYPDSAVWQEAVKKEAEFQVFRLRHHPCIALWCGNNECHQVWEDGWGGKDKQPARFHGEVLYHEILAEVVNRLHPGAAYVPGSPFGGDYCNQGGIGDQHFWDVWHGRGDWTFYRDSTARFCSEFGFMSSPSRATWARAGVETSVSVEEPDARWHNKTGKPFQVIKDLIHLHYPEAANPDEWSYYSQLNQRDAMRRALEHFRFSEFCRGALIWQLNDCWPVESWSLLEFEGRKKAVAYECAQLFAPLMLGLSLHDQGAKLLACLHNSEETAGGEAHVQALSLETGTVLFEQKAQASLEPDEIKTLMDARFEANEPLVWTAAFDDVRVIKPSVKPTGINYEPEIEAKVDGLTVELLSSQVAIDVFVEDIENSSNTFQPNFFSLLAGGHIVLLASAAVGRLRIRCLGFD